MTVTSVDASLEARLSQAKALVAALEQGNEVEADRVLDEMGQVRQSLLFQEIGQLTRQLHDALTAFTLDARLAELTEHEIPDARERLNYVISMTEQAANTTLNVVDEVLPMVADLSDRTASLAQRWQRFLQRQMPYDEFRELSRDITLFLTTLGQGLQQVQGQLNEVLVAQSFQDLTGQIIRRVIDLVQQVERSLLQLIRFVSQQKGEASLKEKNPNKALQGEGPVVPGVDKDDALGNQDDVDDLLSSLGF